MLLVEGGLEINAQDYINYDTPLHCAAHWNMDVEVIKVLIEKGADLNSRNMQNLTPYQYALKHSRCSEIIHFLKGASY